MTEIQIEAKCWDGSGQGQILTEKWELLHEWESFQPSLTKRK